MMWRHGLGHIWPFWVQNIVNSLWSGDLTWQHRTGSTLAQVMVYCLAASCHYLNSIVQMSLIQTLKSIFIMNNKYSGVHDNLFWWLMVKIIFLLGSLLSGFFLSVEIFIGTVKRGVHHLIPTPENSQYQRFPSHRLPWQWIIKVKVIGITNIIQLIGLCFPVMLMMRELPGPQWVKQTLH